MRGRAIGLGLLGLGAFALVAALLVRVLVGPALVKLPLDRGVPPVATGSQVDYLALPAGTQVDGVDAVVKQDVIGRPYAAAAGDDIAVWEFKQVISHGGTAINKVGY